MRECLRCGKPCEPGCDLCPGCVQSELDYDAEGRAEEQERYDAEKRHNATKTGSE